MKKLLLTLLLCLPLAVMAQYKYISLNAQYTVDEKMSKKDIPIYLRKADAPKNYIEIGLIACESDKDKKIFNKAKRKAARHGATGLLVITESEETEVIKAALGKRRRHETRFMAIRVKD